MLEILQPSFDKYQFDAIKGRSTAHALISLLHEWMETLDAGGSVRTMFVDFRKAFDHVDHNLLISKLLSYDIPHCIIRWVYSYLSHRRQRVCVNGELSAWTRLIGGMPQGLWLGQLTFLFLINDLIIECRVHKFIDDTTLTETLLSRPHTCI